MGSDEAWADWLEKNGSALVLLARQWVPTRADAGDVVQEAFVPVSLTFGNARGPSAG